MNTKRILVWFRNDLRIHDQEALFRASEKTAEVVPVYCFDPRHFRATTQGFPKTGSFRAKFLIESVENLRKNLRALGSELIVRVGKPEEEIPQICIQTEAMAVYTSKEITEEECSVERSLEKALSKQGISLELFWQLSLYHSDDLPYPINSLPDTFTQFRKSVERAVTVRKSFPKPNKLVAAKSPAGEIPTLSGLGLSEVVTDSRAAIHFEGGEDAGLARLNQYFWEQDLLKEYKETRNGLLGADYSSKFSAWLAHGCLSPRKVYEEVKAYEQQRVSNSSTYWLIFELIWRDYFKFVAKKYGSKIFLLEGTAGKPIPAKIYKPNFDRWAEGLTGVPFIDANMRELKLTGFMSNRGRQNVASFLVKDLKIDWRWGAAWFESFLVDYDPCSNWCNWNYVAGVGNDPRENRYFNILTQAKRYDAKGEYVKYWLPELEVVSAQRIHMVGELNRKEQQDYGIDLGSTYPLPIINIDRWGKKQYY